MTTKEKLDHAARLVAIEAAAKALSAKLWEVNDDSRYAAVWRVAQLHLGFYTGPSYADELSALDNLLSAPPEPFREYNGGDTPPI